MRDYKKIKVYQFAEQLIIEIYQLTKNFPKEELYGLTSQLRRAAVSVATNIAEGASRQHKRDYLNFLYNSRGSLSEVECLLQLASKLGHLNVRELEKIELSRSETARTLVGLINSVERELDKVELEV